MEERSIKVTYSTASDVFYFFYEKISSLIVKFEGAMLLI
ncbi:hypothetical protein BAK_A0035 (plasmid) [Bacillus anthracis str. A0389]|uniref:Uncharacterized protein n=1 Tax=Bacillus cereus (strain 03BB102) TaxID=572264 RepID=A0A125Y9Y5_BACC3|nr:hypothetical protein BCA_A0126 [Bacillus cereus 03BB102]ACP17695.1 hypothetical protein BAMEG_A0135 [Bacillus anthracis str. CDC 684]ACQ50986.1 hypothetical protein BAA_A0143 [Bacillus anthracis str. A0248]ADK08163.1 hypothetical protein BACI_pCIXO101280 [Bacillus cereus biovar anthracis str. CI]AHK41756.1 hypothetical protein BAPAT_pXO10136 [Bacillus anthracis str. SVA11]EDR85296.1 hypothetical protein BAQ_A0210 [Bacillus anthracis str. A0193]EDR90629.1 hypothetical protein BAH_A0087 [Bac